jgi:hypothetical protein
VTDRTKRIRDAKSEAQKEIEEYRNQKENEYKKFEAEVRLFVAAARMHGHRGRRYIHADHLYSTRADSRQPRPMRTRKPRRS